MVRFRLLLNAAWAKDARRSSSAVYRSSTRPMTSSRVLSAADTAGCPRRAAASSTASMSLPPLGEILRSHQDLARLGAVARPDDPVLLHHIDESGRLGIAEAEAALQEGDRRLPLADHQLDRVPVDLVALGGAPLAVRAAVGRERDLLVHRGALGAEEVADRLDLVVGDPGAVHAELPRGTRRHEDHIAPAQELLGAVAVEHRPRVDLRG